MSLSQEDSFDRRFECRFAGKAMPEFEIDDAMRKEASFDPDLWIVEVEVCRDREGLDRWLTRVAGG